MLKLATGAGFMDGKSGSNFLNRPVWLRLVRVGILDKSGSVPKGETRVTGVPDSKPYESWPKFPDYYLDQYEVTNRQFREFVRAGGYQKKDYWKHDLVRNGKEIWGSGDAILNSS